MFYSKLKVWVFLISVFLIAGVEFTRHVVLADYVDPELNTIFAAFLLVIGSLIFTDYVFRIIEEVDRENRRLLKTTEKARHEAEALYQIGGSLASILDFRRNLDDLVLRIRELFEADWAGVSLLNEATRDIKWEAASGSLSNEYLRHRMKLGQGLAGRVISTGSWIKTEDFPADLTDSPGSYPTLVVEKLSAALAVPVEVRGNVFGALMIGFRRPRRFDDNDVQLLSCIAGQTAIAIDNTRLYNQGQNLAILEERDRIGREMHDSLAQSLSFLNLKAETAELFLEQGNTEKAKNEIIQIKKACSEAYSDIRQTIFSLKTRIEPNLDFLSHLAQYLHEFGLQTGIEVELAVPEGLAVDVSQSVEVQLIRIIQEALTNVRKHAHVTRAVVKFEKTGEDLTVSVIDNGSGFDPETVSGRRTEHFGLDIIRERAEKIGGTLAIGSVPGRGTRVSVTIPPR